MSDDKKQEQGFNLFDIFEGMVNPGGFLARQALGAVNSAPPEAKQEMGNIGLDFLKGGFALGPLTVLNGIFERAHDHLNVPAPEAAAETLEGTTAEISSGAKGVGKAIGELAKPPRPAAPAPVTR